MEKCLIVYTFVLYFESKLEANSHSHRLPQCVADSCFICFVSFSVYYVSFY